MIRTLAVVLLLLGLPPGVAAAAGTQADDFDAKTALGVSQAALGRQIADHAFRDTERRLVRLSDFAGQPLVINLVYTACTHTCPLIIQNLYPAVEAARDALGAGSFTVLTIGFDTRDDTPERMRAFAREQGVDLPNWRFLSADRATIEALTSELGFVFFPSAQGFDHLAQTSVLDGERRVYRQIYGGDLAVPAVVEPLKDLVWGRRSDWASVEGLWNRVKLFCTLYDPRSERYRLDYSIIIGTVIGALSLAGVLIFLIREWRRTERPQAGT